MAVHEPPQLAHVKERCRTCADGMGDFASAQCKQSGIPTHAGAAKIITHSHLRTGTSRTMSQADHMEKQRPLLQPSGADGRGGLNAIGGAEMMGRSARTSVAARWEVRVLSGR